MMCPHKDGDHALALHAVEQIADDEQQEPKCDPHLARDERAAVLRSLAEAHRQIAELHQVVDVIRLQLAGLAL
jgi:hypothetical protein